MSFPSRIVVRDKFQRESIHFWIPPLSRGRRLLEFTPAKAGAGMTRGEGMPEETKYKF